MKTTITIRLEIVGTAADAVAAVEEVLDEGVLQDAINDYACAEGREVQVTSAIQVYE